MNHSTPATASASSDPGDIFKSAANVGVKVAIVTVVVVGILIAMAVMVAPESADPGRNGDLSAQAVAARIQKVGELTLGSADAGGPRTGEELFKGRCAACHAAGLLGSPKFGDKAAWAPRIASGYAALLNSVLKGKNAMPSQAGSGYSDEDVGRALVYMANAGGANFAEPKAAEPAAAASAPAAK